jgi:hypothetical protein
MKASEIRTPVRSRASISGSMLGGLQRDRLFAEHVLAGFRRLQRPFDVLRGGKRNIDTVDRVGSEHLLVGAEGMRRTEPVCKGAGAGMVAACDGGHHAVFGILQLRITCSRPIFAVDRIPHRNMFIPLIAACVAARVRLLGAAAGCHAANQGALKPARYGGCQHPGCNQPPIGWIWADEL